jgi:hypothetical protein
MKKLTLEEWATTYDIEQDERDCFKLYETSGKGYEVALQNSDKVWTMVDDHGVCVIKSGIHFANRLGYYLGTEEVKEEIIVDFE